MTPITNVEAGDANPPIPEQEQACRLEGPARFYPMSPAPLDFNREGIIDDPTITLSHNKSGPEEYAL